MKNKIIKQIEQYVENNPPKSKGTRKEYLKHVYAVRDYALKLAEKEQASKFVCELAVLLHDVESDEQNHAQAGALNAKKVLKKLKVDEEIIDQVSMAIETHSIGCHPKNLQGQIVQDADALGFLDVSYKDYFHYFRKELDDFKKAKERTVKKIKDMREKINTKEGNRYAKELYAKALKWIKFQQ
jgi:HD superfamily phosphodiesterase